MPEVKNNIPKTWREPKGGGQEAYYLSFDRSTDCLIVRQSNHLKPFVQLLRLQGEKRRSSVATDTPGEHLMTPERNEFMTGSNEPFTVLWDRKCASRTDVQEQHRFPNSEAGLLHG